MRCQRAQQRLMAYHDEELSKGASRRLEKHLESCTECSRLLENLRTADHHISESEGVNQMVGVPDMPLPDDRYWAGFTARVLDRVEEDAATRAPERKRRRHGWDLFIPRMAPAFSIALVVVVAAGVLYKAGDLVPVPKAPDTTMKAAQEKDGTDADMEVLTAKLKPAEKELNKDTRDEGDRNDFARKAADPGGTFRSSSSSPTAEAYAEIQGAAVGEAVKKPEPALKVIPEAVPEPAPVTEPVLVSRTEPRSSDAVEEYVETYEAKAEPSSSPEAFAEQEDKPEPAEQTILKGIAEGTTESKKQQAPVMAAGAEEGDAKAAPKLEAAAAIRSNIKAEKTSPSAPLKRDDGKTLVEEAGISAPEKPREVMPEQNETSRTRVAQPAVQKDEFSTAVILEDAGLGAAGGRDDQVPGMTTFAATTPPELSANAPGMDNSVVVTEPASVAVVKDTAPLVAVEAQDIEKIEESGTEVGESALAGPTVESKQAAPKAAAVESPADPKESGQAFGSRQPYRGPQDQLIHAKSLAEVRKFWESEQVLKDLLSQRPPASIQEEASILLVKVLSSQNRIGEAQQVLDDAKGQFPANNMIQTFELKQESQ